MSVDSIELSNYPFRIEYKAIWTEEVYVDDMGEYPKWDYKSLSPDELQKILSNDHVRNLDIGIPTIINHDDIKYQFDIDIDSIYDLFSSFEDDYGIAISSAKNYLIRTDSVNMNQMVEIANVVEPLVVINNLLHRPSFDNSKFGLSYHRYAMSQPQYFPDTLDEYKRKYDSNSFKINLNHLIHLDFTFKADSPSFLAERVNEMMINLDQSVGGGTYITNPSIYSHISDKLLKISKFIEKKYEGKYKMSWNLPFVHSIEKIFDITIIEVTPKEFGSIVIRPIGYPLMKESKVYELPTASGLSPYNSKPVRKLGLSEPLKEKPIKKEKKSGPWQKLFKSLFNG